MGKIPTPVKLVRCPSSGTPHAMTDARRGRPVRDAPRLEGLPQALPRPLQPAAAGESAAVVNASAKNSSSGSPQRAVKSAFAESTTIGAPQA